MLIRLIAYAYKLFDTSLSLHLRKLSAVCTSQIYDGGLAGDATASNAAATDDAATAHAAECFYERAKRNAKSYISLS